MEQPMESLKTILHRVATQRRSPGQMTTHGFPQGSQPMNGPPSLIDEDGRNPNQKFNGRCGFDRDELVAPLSTFTPELQPDAKARCEAAQMLAAAHAWLAGEIPCVTFSGGPGIGKSHMLKGAICELAMMPQWVSCYYITAYEFDRRIKDFKSQRERAEEIREGTYTDPDEWLQRLAQVKFLAVDDIGAGYVDKGWTQKRFEMLFDLRYRTPVFTMVSTNLSGNEFRAAVGERIYSRLWDQANGAVFQFTSLKDMRPRWRELKA